MLNKTNIMTAILQTPGPVSTHQTINKYWKFLRCSTVKQFLAAAGELQTMNLGSMVPVTVGKGARPTIVFVKRLPVDACRILQSNLDICSPQLYTDKFNGNIPKCITLRMRSYLVSNGFVSEKLLI